MDYGFDYQKAVLIVESFSKSTELSCRLIDVYGETLIGYGQGLELIKDLKLNADLIRDSFLYGANQALIYGGSYVFFGPYGFVYMSTPIVHASQILGAFIVGPILMTNPDTYLYEGIIKSSQLEDITLDFLEEHIEAVPIITPSKVKALSDLLFVSGHYVSNEAYDQFIKDQELLKQKSEIVTYMGYLKTMGGEAIEGPAYSIEKEKELMGFISLGDQEGANRLLNEIIAYIYMDYGMNFDLLKSRVLELVVLLSRAALEGGAQVEEVFGLNYGYLNAIHTFKTVDELTQWLAKICKRFTMSVFGFGEAKHKDAIYKAMDYIKHNYMTKLALEDVAEQVCFSPTYFSKIFKDEMGVTYNKYLNKVRITKSKQLLKDKDLGIADIADMIGFHDQSHFTKIFKSMTNTSPKKYREGL